MIYGNILSKLGTQYVPPVLKKAFTYLAETDFSQLNFGVYTPDEDFTVQVIDLLTKRFEDTRTEVHRENLDIHYSITGEETVYVRVAPFRNTISEDLFETKDIAFYDEMDEETALHFCPGDFAVFFPGEIHRPGCCRESPDKIKKIVIKIHKSKLEQ